MSAALDGGTQVMVFVYTFAVGGGSGNVVDFPRWALVSVGHNLDTASIDCVYVEPRGKP